jgi:phosphomannomutase
MSNIGLELALRDAGMGIVRCPVGDKYVMEEMLRRGCRSAESSRDTSSSPTICSPATGWPPPSACCG